MVLRGRLDRAVAVRFARYCPFATSEVPDLTDTLRGDFTEMVKQRIGVYMT